MIKGKGKICKQGFNKTPRKDLVIEKKRNYRLKKLRLSPELIF